jgi:hypothetical protein
VRGGFEIFFYQYPSPPPLAKGRFITDLELLTKKKVEASIPCGLAAGFFISSVSIINTISHTTQFISLCWKYDIIHNVSK